MPHAPLVGAVTTRPPAAFSSLTARANMLIQSITSSDRGRDYRWRPADAVTLPRGGGTFSGPGSTPSVFMPRSIPVAITLPDAGKASVNLLFAPQRQFILHHQAGNREPLSFTQRQQFAGGMKIIRHRFFYVVRLTKTLLFDNKAAANRVIRFV
ncbi:Uncharacterised protein [Salmonella enterica subsp. enterica serovar Typhimurium]|nr:Uncharacterised protein [Salmonella enterica subsp. enterica serovar Typhimurium]